MNPHTLRLDADGVYRVPLLDQFDWLEHGFGTRLSTDWPDSSRLATLKQIHSATVVAATGGLGVLGQGDALITNRSGLLIGVRTADCVPILLVDPENRAVAAVHAGWRGTEQRIALGSISELTSHFGTRANDIYAAIGPCIGECCFEVGPEVARAFARWRPELNGIDRQVKLDLVEFNRQQLTDAGVLPERITAGAPCTRCTAETLHSFRRDRETSGRMISAVGIRQN